MNRDQLIKEIKRIDKEIKSFNLTDDQRRKERVKVTGEYNEVKDQALKAIGLVAEFEGKSIAKVLKERGFNFDSS